MNLTEMLANLDAAIQDGDRVITGPNREKALQQAVRYYSKFRPYEHTVDIPGDDGFEYALPTDFDIETSTILSIEFPVDVSSPTSPREPRYLTENAWWLYRLPPNVFMLRFTGITPAVGETVRVVYEGTHVVTTSSSTVPIQDSDAVVNKAACICCIWLASHYSQAGESTLNAQVANHQSKATHYRAQAKLFCGMFDEYLGIGPDAPVVGAGLFVTVMPSTYPWGEGRLTHWETFRNPRWRAS